MRADSKHSPAKETAKSQRVYTPLRARGWIILILTLLVVYAIGYLERPRPRPTARAQEEIHCIEVACTAILRDAGQPDFFSLFNDLAPMRESYGTYQHMWNAVILDLLRNGKNAECDLKPEIAERLASTYMATLGDDPWGNPYQCFAGPLTKYGTPGAPYWFRIYRPPGRPIYTDRNGQTQVDFYYDDQAAAEAEAEFPGAPEPDGLPGFPAPTDLTIYIWSLGKDGESCQRVEADLSPESVNIGPSTNSGDDINNWDSDRSWCVLY